MKYGPIDSCQLCNATELRSVLFLGFLPPVNSMRPLGTSPDKEYWFPAEIRYCRACHLVQLGFAVEPNILFPPEYPYTSGSTRILRENFAELYCEVRAKVKLSDNDLIVDIGSNDGTLLSNFQAGGHRVAGIEPTLTGELAQARGIPTLTAYFDEDSVKQVMDQHGAPRVVTAANVFAHIHDVHQVMNCIEQLIGDDGVFISESHYLLDLIETLQYDTIYHEHLRHYSVTSLKHLLEMHGFRIFHVNRIPTHGGSIRVYASKSDAFATDPSVTRILDIEAQAGLASEGWIEGFRERVIRSKLDLYELLSVIKRKEGRIYGIGAPSRASTLINYVGIDEGILDCVLEIQGSKKINKYVPGRNIPVLDEAKLYKDQPEFVLLLSWHIADELCRNIKSRGYRGDFIVPLPEPHIIPSREVSGPEPVKQDVV